MGSILLMDEAGKDDKGGGGGSGGNKDIDDLKAQNAALLARLDALEKAKPAPEDPTLVDKVRKQKEEAEKNQGHEKSLESALKFNISAKDFVKYNKGLVPDTIESLFTQAEKETYDSAIEKANAIKAGIVQEFFSVQANYDDLTTDQKIQLDQFMKLTKNGKQEKAASVYSMIFEPSLENRRKIEKAKEVNKGGKAQTDSEKMQAEKLLKLGKQRYLGEK